ncbi:hypothetical protein [Stackebrandtia soli]|uniref:hypothetical protein n=1 Tax=Stackebrandtia soli TaxID=1892856 RepID=UPI0039EB000A
MDGERLIGRGGEVETVAAWRSRGSAPWAGRDVRVYRVTTSYIVEMTGHHDHTGRRAYATEIEALTVAERLRDTPDVLGEQSQWTQTHPQAGANPG